MKNKLKFNWFDVVVCVIIVVLVAGALYKFNVADGTSTASASESITYTIKISSIRQGTVNAIQVGDVLYDTDSDNEVGTISAIEVTDASINLSDTSTGTLINGTIEDKYDLYVTVSATGLVSDGYYYVNSNYELNVGSSRSLYTKYASFTGKIFSIE